MQCCVSFCENTSDNMSTSERTGITFHVLPSDIHVRAAWLKALGTQDHHLSTPAVVCSQHFLDDDFYVTESCVRQIRSDAIPSTVQMCMMCLDTNSKLFLMSKHKLDEVYEQLTGLSLFQLCHRGNLKQTLCVLCAQRLINFSRFRDLSLRAHSLMMDLVEQHGFMTTQHIELVNNATEHLKCNLTQTTLATNHCDLYINHTDEEEQTAAEESAAGDVAAAVVKHEDSSEPMLINDYYLELTCEDDKHMKNTTNDCVPDDKYSNTTIKLEPSSLDEEVNDTHAAETESCIKSESAIFECTFCFEEFVQQDDYNKHMRMHLQNAGGDAACGAAASCSWDSLVPDNKSGSRLLNADPAPSARKLFLVVAPLSVRRDANTPDNDKLQTSEGTVPIPSSEQMLGTDIDALDQPQSNSDVNARVPMRTAGRPTRAALDKPYKTPSSKRYHCDLCQYKTVNVGNLLRHKRTHTGEKPYSCDVCDYRSAQKCALVSHKRTHTGEKNPYKPNSTKLYLCGSCTYKTVTKGNFLRHQRVHTGEKPFSCDECNYKCGQKTALLRHIKKIHSAEKNTPRARYDLPRPNPGPYSCDSCEYKTVSKRNLFRHKRIHTGEKPYSCDVCNYRGAQSAALIAHKKTHTGEKPFTCDICQSVFTQKNSVIKHMKTHTGFKPYSCEICEYKCAYKHSLSRHMRTHTGEKPYACELCDSAFTLKGNWLRHVRKHHNDKSR